MVPVIAVVQEAQLVCPMPAGPMLLKGTELWLRTAHEELTVKAPKFYMQPLFDWCNGAHTLADIAELAKSKWGDEVFVSFVLDLLNEGVLIDAAGVLAHTARTVRQPSGLGRAARKSVWLPGVRGLPLGLSHGAEPLPAWPGSPLKSLLAKRQSATGFAPGSMRSEQLAALLGAAYGQALATDAARRTVASGGGFYQLQLTVILLRPVDTFEPGVYRVEYDAQGHVGLHLVTYDIGLLPRAITQPDALQNASGWLLVSADLGPATLKYKNRAYPVALLEAGGVLQNVALACTEFESPCVGWRPIAAYQDAPLAQLCRLDTAQFILTTGVFGVRDVFAKPDATLALDFNWLDPSGELPFYLARASIFEAVEVGEVKQSGSCWGRDADPSEAANKAIAEAVERYACEQPVGVIHSTFAALPDAIDPTSVLAYSAAQYRHGQLPFSPFDAKAVYAWVPMQQVDGSSTAHVLADFAAYPGAFERSGKPYTTANTSGCASGTSFAFALESATMELIERDAFMRHWFAQCGGMAVRRESLPADLLCRVQRLEGKGCVVSVQVLNKGVLPAFLVMVQHAAMHFTAVGAAASWTEPRSALLSALQEAETGAYYRLASPAAEPLRPQDVLIPSHHADLYAQPRYFRRADALLKVEGDVDFEQATAGPNPGGVTLFEFLHFKGYQVWWRDLSVPNAPRTLKGERIFTVRAVAPGLIPMIFGFGNVPLRSASSVASTHPSAKFPHPFS